MILLEDVLDLHRKSIDRYGGSHGLRDIALLESAIARPMQTFDGIEFYPSITEKAAALAESLIKNHPFIDGNKRIGFLSMVALIETNDYEFTASQEEAYRFIIEIASGNIHFDQIVLWLQNHTQPC